MDLSTEAIRQHVGGVSFTRGREYFTEGAVKDIAMDDNMIIGLVQGSEAKPYEVEVEIERGGIINSDCSCPVGYACKHVAALCLQALLMFAKSPNLQAARSTKDPKALRSNWRLKLDRLIGDDYQTLPEKTFQVEMLIKIEQKIPSHYYYNLLRSYDRQVTLPSLQPSFQPEVSLRPRIYDLTGKYSASEVTWQTAWYGTNSVYWNGAQGKVEPKQFLYLQMLSHALSSGYQTGWMVIPEEKARYVWELLERAEEFGVKLLGGQKGQLSVKLGCEPINLSLEIGESGESLVLKKRLTSQTDEIFPNDLILVGDPIAFAIWEKEQSYHLRPVAGSSSRKELAQLDQPLEIPVQDRPELEQVLPKLAKKFQLNVKTSTVKMPQIARPQAIIRLAPKKKGQVKVEVGLVLKNKFILLIETPEAVTIDQTVFILDQPTVLQIRQVLEQGLESLAAAHRISMSALLKEGIWLEGIEAARFSTEIIPKLQMLLPDLVVQAVGNLPQYVEDTSTPEVTLSVEEDELERDWFDLGINVMVGSEIVPFHQLFSALVEEQEYLLLESGRYFSLKVPQFDQLRRLIAETKSIKESDGSALKISRFQAGLWEELRRLGVVEKQAKKWQQMMKGLLSVKEIKLSPPPQSLQAIMRPYQLEGYCWLKFLRDYNLGGVLADDMGLGKTLQSISLVAAVKAEKKLKQPFLVVAPTSVVENWEIELERFAPFLQRVILRAGDRTQVYEGLAGADIVVTSYALLVRDFDRIKKQAFDTLILDEAQKVKNYQSKAYSLIRQIKVQSRFALTGTPLENNLMELWSIFSIVTPGLFPEPKKFQELYRTPIEKCQDVQALKQLRNRIRLFMIRRQKGVVEKQLPAKNEQVLFLDLNEKHRHLYDLQLQQERKRVLGLLQEGGLKEHRFEILRSLMKMRQMCLHPQLVDKKYSNVAATKIEALKDQIEEIVSEQHRVLIFSQFTSFLIKVREILNNLGVEYLYLDGQTKNRGELVKRFQTADVSVFVISLKSGGFGLNLTAADYCILLDPWWNPAVEQQAIDRIHRIGQTKPVFVYKMIAKNTIEEKVLQLQQKKQRLFRNIMEEGNLFGSAITEEDIHRLFEVQ